MPTAMIAAKPKPKVEVRGKQFELKGRKLVRSAGTGTDRLTIVKDLRQVFARDGKIETLKKFIEKGNIRSLYVELGIKFTDFLDAGFTIGQLYVQGLTAKEIIDEFNKLDVRQKTRYGLNKKKIFEWLMGAGAPRYETLTLLSGKDPVKEINEQVANEKRIIADEKATQDNAIAVRISPFLEDVKRYQTGERIDNNTKLANDTLYAIQQSKDPYVKQLHNALAVLRTKYSANRTSQTYVSEVQNAFDVIKNSIIDKDFASRLKRTRVTGWTFGPEKTTMNVYDVMQRFVNFSMDRFTLDTVEQAGKELRVNMLSSKSIDEVLKAAENMKLSDESKAKYIKELFKRSGQSVDSFVYDVISSAFGDLGFDGKMPKASKVISKLIDVFGAKTIFKAISKMITFVQYGREIPILRRRMTDVLSYLDYENLNQEDFGIIFDFVKTTGIPIYSESFLERYISSRMGPILKTNKLFNNGMSNLLESYFKEGGLSKSPQALRYITPLAFVVHQLVEEFGLQNKVETIKTVHSLFVRKFGKQTADLVFASTIMYEHIKR